MKRGLILILSALTAAVLLAGCHAADGTAEPDPAGPLAVSGVIRADEILVSAQAAGTVQWLGAKEGDAVAQGEVLARLDTSLIDAQIVQAEATLQTALAQAAKVQRSASPEEIAVVNTAVVRAGEDVVAAQKAISVTKGSVASAEATLQMAWAEQARVLAGVNPQEAAAAQGRITTTQNLLGPLSRMRDAIGGLEQSGALPSGSYDAAQAALAQAELSVTIAGLQAESLSARARPQDLQVAQAGVDAATAGLQAAQFRVQEAEKRLEAALARLRQSQAQANLLKAGASPELIALTEAPVRSARAALRVLEVRRNQATLTARSSGVILERDVSLGEQVLAGAALYRLGDLETVELTVYIPSVDISRVHPSQVVRVTTGSFPDRVFDGEVIHISPQAEFTPNFAAGTEASTSEVFAVKIQLPNPDGELRPGMPASAVFVDR